MKRACFLLVLLVGCSSTHEILQTRDGGPPDAAVPDAAADAAVGECGPPPPPGAPCNFFIDDRDGVYCCDQTPVPLECRDGAWQCPSVHVDRSECHVFSDSGHPGCGFSTGCEPMDVRTRRLSEAACFGPREVLYEWDGRACRPIEVGCAFSECEGSDCALLYADLAACRADRETCGPACEAMDVRLDPADPQPCDDAGAVTWWWNGWACERFVGCRADDDGCQGADCDARYLDRATCEADRGVCISQCEASAATLERCEDGASATYYVWDGHACRGVQSCAASPVCTGPDCDEVFDDEAACVSSRTHCVGPVRPRAALTCGLGEAQIISAALRLSACGVADTNDVIGGYFELGMADSRRSPSPGYVPDCRIAQCASTATDCAELTECLEARRGAACDPSRISTCVGSEIQACDGEALVPLADCRDLNGYCVEEPTSGERTIAHCEIPGNASIGAGTTWCDENALVVNIDGAAVRISCEEHLPGTVCREIRYASEFPGVVCGYASPTCSEYDSSTVACEGTIAQLCVGGRPRSVDCVTAGYARCEDGVGCR